MRKSIVKLTVEKNKDQWTLFLLKPAIAVNAPSFVEALRRLATDIEYTAEWTLEDQTRETQWDILDARDLCRKEED